MKNTRKSKSHAVFNLKLHLVLVTKFRRKALTPEMLTYLKGASSEILAQCDCTLVEFGGEADHVHLLLDVHPSLNISVLVNNLKTASSRRVRNRFKEHLAQFYWKSLLWHRAYFVSSVGGATLETVRAYVEAQGTVARAYTKRRPKKPGSSLDPHPA